MIDFAAGDEAQMLQDAVERFCREHLIPELRSAEAARAPAATTATLYERLGLMGLEAPGAGLGMVERCLVNEALGRGDAGAALALDRLGPAGYALWETNDDDTAQEILADPTRRAWLITPHDAALTMSGNTVSGTVAFAPAGVTDLLVLATDGVALVRDGFRESAVRGAGLRAMNPVTIILADAPVARFHHTAAGPILARARLYLASLLLGVMEAASTYARGYAMERVAFGRPIAHHQALTFLLTDMNTAVAGTRLLIHEAAWRADRLRYASPADSDAAHGLTEAAATAFAEAAEQAVFVGPNGVQVLGGLGFMQDYPVEKYMREARALGLLYGGLDGARDDAMRRPATALMADGEF
jgi:alkylation response protein AidB-like acyl-CoA dehydrogenase